MLVGIQRHGVAGTESSLVLVVERILALGCPNSLRKELGGVVASLKAMDYPKQQQIEELQMLASEL